MRVFILSAPGEEHELEGEGGEMGGYSPEGEEALGTGVRNSRVR